MACYGEPLMGTIDYQQLLGDDISYPEDRYHAYLKLFSHAWNFGRVDLGVLGIEWILYLIFTAFITVKSANLVKWDFIYISIPLFIALVLGCMRTAFWYVFLMSSRIEFRSLTHSCS